MIIAVKGAPGSGKTSFCIHLGRELAREKHEAVLILHIERYCPEMNRLFPGEEELCSLGAVLDRGLNDENLILKHVKTVPEAPNLGFLGYLSDEGDKYAALTRPGIEDFLATVQKVAPFVIADFGNEEPGLLGQCIEEAADRTVTVIAPDLRSAAWLGKGRRPIGELLIQNLTAKSMSPVELGEACPGKCIVLPYCAEIARGGENGMAVRTEPAAKYKKELRKAVEAL